MSNVGFTLGHVHLKVKDIDTAIAFYTDIFDLSVRERVGTYVFLASGERHHDLALHLVPPEAHSPSLKDVGLYHFAVEMPTVADLKTVYMRLRHAGIPAKSVNHGISKVLYLADPDGNGIEVYVDTRAETGRTEWNGESSPLDLEAVSLP